MRGEDGVLVRGKFIPIRSGHLPPQRQVHGIFEMPATGSGQGQRTMTGALTDDPPARVVRFEARDGNTNRNFRSREGEAGQGAKPKNKTEREQRRERWLKNAYWVIFCCGLCEEYDLAADNPSHGVQNMAVRGGERRRYGGCLRRLYRKWVSFR